MRTLICGLALAAMAGMATPAAAQNYPWCAHYGGVWAGGVNCGFSTYAQCLATIRGVGGTCLRNSLYEPRQRHVPRRVKRSKRYRG